jgi:hypothetical protein
MVKILLLPKSIEEQCIKWIKNGSDESLVRNICMPCNMEQNHIIIAYCRDLWKVWEDYNDPTTLLKHFQNLYNYWSPNKYNVEIVPFSFHDDPTNKEGILRLLNAPASGSATIFYMGGVHGLSGSTPINASPSHVAQLIALLKEKVQQNLISYIGVCGGATLAGRSTDYVHIPFDLLSGTTVVYDSGISAQRIGEIQTNVAQDVVHFTTGCALAIVLSANNKCGAISFPCIKNSAQWKPFARANTIALQKWLQFKAISSLLLPQPLPLEDVGYFQQMD